MEGADVSGAWADRVASHLMRRLQHARLWKRVEAAATLGLLETLKATVAVDGHDYGVHRYVPAPGQGFSGHADGDMAFLQRTFLGGRRTIERGMEIPEDGLDTPTLDTLGNDLAASKRKGAAPPPLASDGRQAVVDWAYLLGLLGRLSSVDDVASLAVLQLLRRGIADCVFTRSSGLSRLSRPGNLILIRSDVEGFAEKLVGMLKAGLLTGRRMKIEREGSPASASRTWGIKAGRTIRLINNEDLDDTPHRELEQQAAGALSRGDHVLVVHEGDTTVPPALHAAADFTISIGPIGAAIVRPLMDALHGTEGNKGPLDLPPEFSLRRLDNLMLALRPWCSRDDSLRLLRELARIEAQSGREDETGALGRFAASSTHSNRGSRSDLRKERQEQPTGSRLIQPQVDTDASTVHPSPFEGPASAPARTTHRLLTVETLSGYGDTRDWALNLKSDLELWRDGAVEWDEMSTRLLLSGPPGTGKTMFARALCNSLRLPMLATSVSTWLQPGYLGDVLERVSSAFEEAQRNAPSILFIDECDAIGSRRDNTRDHADYWNTVIAHLLEQMDGVVKTSGVIIVGATNRPEFIDKALTRPGRLEKHVSIPKPDVDALCDILAHHIGRDLASVLDTAPLAPTRVGTVEAAR